MTTDYGFWIAFVIFVVGCAHLQHEVNVDCRNRGGTVIEGFWADKCEGAK